MNISKKLYTQDPEIARSLEKEHQRIENTLNFIASENYASPLVIETTGSVMTNKYAEGYPKRRYYGGCENVDTAEELARDRLLALFGLDPEKFHANVQPHSGAQANMSVFFSCLNIGDTILGMDLAAGGHLTHGYKINFSGKYYNSASYGVDPETERLNYDEIRRLAHEHKPQLIIAGASAYSRIIDFKEFRTIADEVGAKLMVDMAHIAGLVAAGVHPAPFEYADFVTSTTHKTLRGPRGGIIICKKEYGQQVDKAVMPGIQGGPLMHHIAAKAIAFKEAKSQDFIDYQKQVVKNAQTMAQAFTDKGYRIVSGGTDNHLMIVDLRSKKLTGKIAESTLEQAGISLNKNCIPNDPEKPLVTSGIRLGTPAVTTRGFTENEIKDSVDLIDRALSNIDDAGELEKVKAEVQVLCQKFPVYPQLTQEELFITPAIHSPQKNA